MSAPRTPVWNGNSKPGWEAQEQIDRLQAEVERLTHLYRHGLEDMERTRKYAQTELARLRERDARVRELLERLLDLDADPELREAIALLKETP